MTTSKSKSAASASKPRAKAPARAPASGTSLPAWAKTQSPAHRATCDALRKLIDAALPKATSKVWHGAPVWFLGENPVVGYSVKASGVSLLFWNGVAFGDAALKPVGKYGAAEAVFRSIDELDAKLVRRWLRKSGTDVFDSKAFFSKLRQGK